MEQFAKLGPIQAAGRFWASLTSTQRFITAIFAVTSIVLLVLVSIIATRPRMGVLFSGLEADDAGAIVARLQERKIEYDLEGGGSVIKVPAKDVYKTRLALASSGLPQGSNVGFEIFDKASLGMTEFAQRMNYQRALQGELARTIGQLDQVEQSRVHLAIPEPSVFEDKEKHPAASVIVKLRPGGQLAPEQVGGIVHLVSSAVEGMKPNYVTVVDTRGNVLSEASDSTDALDARLSATQLQLKREHEHQIEKNIQSMLERVAGPNKAIVRVNAKVNFDRRETDSEIYRPLAENKGVVLSEERVEESYNGSSGTVGGPVGVRGNIRRQSVTAREGEPGGYRRVETNSKYQVSRTTEHVIKAPGTVEQLSVAVMLDGKVDQSRIPAIRSAVEAAAGVDLTKGDKVIVESVPFDDTALKEEAKEMKAAAARETFLSYGKTAAGVLLLFGFLFFLRGMLRQIKIGVPAGVTSPLGSVQVASAADAPAAKLAPEAAPAPLDPSAVLAQAKPEDVAKVVKEWISKQ